MPTYTLIDRDQMEQDRATAGLVCLSGLAFREWERKVGNRDVVLIFPCKADEQPAPDHTIMPFARWMENEDWYVDEQFPDCVLFRGHYQLALLKLRMFDQFGLRCAFVTEEVSNAED